MASVENSAAGLDCDLAIVGAGPAGMRAAEVAALAGRERGETWRIAIFDGKPSVGRKFLVAGRGGLNLTHSEPLDRFIPRYGEATERWRDLLAGFGPADLRTWAAGLETETFVGTSGRVFPREKQAAGLLRRWVKRLRALGVAFHVNHRWERVEPAAAGGTGWRLGFRLRTADTPDGAEPREVRARAVVFALGGASWPQTGSDGAWQEAFRALGVPVAPWQPANCGWEIEPPWSPEFLAAAEGQPLKNIVLTAGGRTVAGELLVTAYGIEGGALYQLGATLRAQTPPARLEIDLKPQLSAAALAAKLSGTPRIFSAEETARRWRLSPAARALLESGGPGAPTRDPGAWLAVVKNFPLTLRGPRPIAEAISSAGGIRWEALDASLMLRAFPGLFAAGEMIDWEAPTGGYLLQGSFATGTRAGQGAAEFLRRDGGS